MTEFASNAVKISSSSPRVIVGNWTFKSSIVVNRLRLSSGLIGDHLDVNALLADAVTLDKNHTIYGM